MGFLRGSGKFIGSIVFTTVLVLAIFNMEMMSFTSYENFKALIGGVFENQFSTVSEQDLSDIYDVLLFQCSQAESVTLPLSTGQPLQVKCEDVRKSERTQVKSLITTALAESFYYKDFECSYVECLTSGNPENLLVVVTNEGNQFYKNLQMLLWLGTGLGLAILLVSIGTWTGRLKGVGFNLVFTGLPFLVLGYAQDILFSSLTTDISSAIQPITDNLISSLSAKFMIVLVAGGVLLVADYGVGLLQKKSKGK